MSRKPCKYTIRLDDSLNQRIVVHAKLLGVTPAEVFRRAAHTFLADTNALTESQQRQLRVMEFLQLSLDVIIREQFPDFRDQIVANTDKRMSQYHGQR